MSEQTLQNQIDRLYRRILMTVAPAKITATDDTDAIHRVQIRVNGTPEVIDQVGVQQIYGLASHAPVGTDATALFVAGQRSNAVILGTGNQPARLRNQKPGEISLYTDEGDTIGLNRDNKINLKSKDSITVDGENSFAVNTKKATIKAEDEVVHDSPLTTIKNNLKADGQIDASGGFFQNGQPIGDGGGGGPGPPGPQGQPGPQGEQGPQGPQGEPGRTVLNGAGPPPAALGVNGDFYVNTLNQYMYGPKANNTWPTTGVPMIGPPGATGGVGPPGPAGADGAAGPQGATGAQGPQGNPGTAGAQGPPGADSIVPGPAGSQGPAGTAGATGAQGPPGAASTVPGPQGPAGLQGPQGLQGATGPQGAQGPVNLDALPLTGGTLSGPLGINQPGGAYPLVIQAANPRTRYITEGGSSWTIGPGPAGQFAIADEAASPAARLNIDLAGLVLIQQNLQVNNGAYINGLYPGQPYGLIAEQLAEFRAGLHASAIYSPGEIFSAGRFTAMAEAEIYGGATIDYLVVTGRAWKPGGGVWEDNSDRRLKHAIEPYRRGLADVLRLEPVTFEFNGKGETPADGRRYTGLVADDVRAVMPEMVGTRRGKLDPDDAEETDILTLDATPLIYALLNAVKELAAQVAALQWPQDGVGGG